MLNPYLYCSIFGSIIFILFSYAARKYYEAEHKFKIKTKSASEQRLNILMQAIVVFIVAGICMGGLFAAFRIKRSLVSGDGIIKNEGQLVFFLFGISVLLILIVLLLIFFLTVGLRKILKKNRTMNEVKRNRLSFVITIAVTFVLMGCVVVYNSEMLYNASVVSTYEDGAEEIKTVSKELENYLTVASTTLRVTADNVDLMYKDGCSSGEIEKYIVDQTKKLSEQFDENFTGLYAYIDGEYLDGLGWVPPQDYEPTSRAWYKTAVSAQGETAIVSPYVDAQTGSVVITFARCISEGSDDQSKMLYVWM